MERIRRPFNDDLYGHHSLPERYEKRVEFAATPFGQIMQEIRFFVPGWESVLAKCESPIEKMMCRLLHRALDAIPNGGIYNLDDLLEIAEKSPRSSVIVAYAQQKIGRCRADFLIACYDKKEGRPRLFVIECDGKEFHQDVMADRQRDAFFLGLGIGVLRFTGAEINEGAPDLGARVAIAVAMGA